MEDVGRTLRVGKCDRFELDVLELAQALLLRYLRIETLAAQLPVTLFRVKAGDDIVGGHHLAALLAAGLLGSSALHATENSRPLNPGRRCPLPRRSVPKSDRTRRSGGWLMTDG
jgi:hypothetical protein